MSHNTKRPEKDVFFSAIKEMGQVTSVLSQHFNVHPDTVLTWYEYYDLDAPYKYVLTASDIPLVRSLKGVMSSTKAGAKFEVSGRTIRDVWNGKTWGWI